MFNITPLSIYYKDLKRRYPRIIIVIIVSLILIISSVCLKLSSGLSNQEFAQSLSTEIFGAFIAFIVITVIIEMYDKRKWEGVNQLSLSALSDNLFLLYSYLSFLCESRSEYETRINKESEDSFGESIKLSNDSNYDNYRLEGKNLYFLSQIENITFSDYGVEVLFGNNSSSNLNSHLCYRFIPVFNKWMRIYDPKVIELLSSIEKNLNILFSMHKNVSSLRPRNTKIEDDCLEKMKPVFAEIFKNIQELQEQHNVPIFTKIQY
jgi:hypothetical protein